MHRRARAMTTAAVATGILAAAGCGLVEQDTPEVLRIGTSLPLTGASSHLGTIYAQALQLRVDGLRDRDPEDLRVELEILDNRSDPETTTNQLRELAADPDVAAIITAGCPDCVAGIAEELTVPVVSIDPVRTLVDPPRRWVFKIGPDPGDNADMIALDMASQDVTTIGVIASADSYGRQGVEELSTAADRAGLDIVVTSEAGGDPAGAAAEVAGWQPPFDPTLFEQPPPGPDAVVVWVPAPDANEVAIAVRDAGYDGLLYLDMMAGDELYLPGGGQLRGTRIVATSAVVIDRETLGTLAAAEQRTWWETYLSTYSVYHLQSTFGADAAHLVIHAAATLPGEITRDGLRSAIEATRSDGYTGLLALTPSRHSALHPSSLRIVTAEERWT